MINLNKFSYLLGSPLCYFCSNEIEFYDDLPIDGICNKCFNNIVLIYKKYRRCPICSAVMNGETCDKFHHKNIENVFSLLSLNNDLYQLYLKAKYRKDKNLMNIFVKILDYFLPEDIIEKYCKNVDFITYVPISLNKKILRNYNPSRLFAKILSKKVNKPLIPFFYERGLNYFHIQRKENQILFADRFIFNNNYVKLKNLDLINKNILIVDDIYTTGKTASFLADLLLLNKASKIYLLTFFNHR
ncbi:MAG: ComF family protein [Exilispira sp.]